MSTSPFQELREITVRLLLTLDNVRRGASTAPAFIMLGNLSAKIDELESRFAESERPEPTFY